MLLTWQKSLCVTNTYVIQLDGKSEISEHGRAMERMRMTRKL